MTESKKSNVVLYYFILFPDLRSLIADRDGGHVSRCAASQTVVDLETTIRAFVVEEGARPGKTTYFFTIENV